HRAQRHLTPFPPRRSSDLARWVAAATICRLVPYVVFGPLGGVVADRYDRRTVLLAGDVARCLLMVALAVVVETDGPVALVLVLRSEEHTSELQSPCNFVCR